MNHKDSNYTCAAVRAKNVTKSYFCHGITIEVLKDISVTFEKGKLTAIIGRSGSGKSTLMHCLAGLDSITQGRIYIGNTNITKLNDSKITEIRRQHIGFIFQSFNLISTLNVMENIILPLKLSKKNLDNRWLDSILTTLNIQEYLDFKPYQLSGGLQQRVAIARALITKPDVIFGDEPTGSLDSISGKNVLNLLHNYVKIHKQTLIIVTHDQKVASYADNVVILNDGEIVNIIKNSTLDKISNAFENLDG